MISVSHIAHSNHGTSKRNLFSGHEAKMDLYINTKCDVDVTERTMTECEAQVLHSFRWEVKPRGIGIFLPLYPVTY